MRKLIIATTALAFLSSTAFAQDKAAAPAAPSGDTMSKGDMSKDKMSKKKMTKSKKSTSKMSTEPKQ
jgi:pentapeptide MXKDX repeat protein